ncbi:MAG: STAS domain-containing protein [Rhodanobacteraceae bacterium]
MAGKGKRSRRLECRVTLAPDLVVAGAGELHAQLCEALAQPAPVVLDAAAVARLDTSGLQLLEAFVHARDEAAGPWRWDNVGEMLREASARLGLQRMLQLPDAAPASN